MTTATMTATAVREDAQGEKPKETPQQYAERQVGNLERLLHIHDYGDSRWISQTLSLDDPNLDELLGLEEELRQLQRNLNEPRVPIFDVGAQARDACNRAYDIRVELGWGRRHRNDSERDHEGPEHRQSRKPTMSGPKPDRLRKLDEKRQRDRVERLARRGAGKGK